MAARPATVPAVLGGAVLQPELDAFLAAHEDELIAFRRDLHAHPELGYAEHRTTAKIAERLRAAGLDPVVLPKGTGLYCDIGPADGTTVALRADIDALPLHDEKEDAPTGRRSRASRTRAATTSTP